MIVVSFPGGHLRIEFTYDAPDDEQPRLVAWLELRADDPAAVLQAGLDAGLPRSSIRDLLLLHNSWLPGVHHRLNELNAAGGGEGWRFLASLGRLRVARTCPGALRRCPWM
jgi:hypothetical protein